MIHSDWPLSVTCTGLPVRVMRFTLSGSRSSVRSVTVFICLTVLADSSHVNPVG